VAGSFHIAAFPESKVPHPRSPRHPWRPVCLAARPSLPQGLAETQVLQEPLAQHHDHRMSVNDTSEYSSNDRIPRRASALNIHVSPAQDSPGLSRYVF